MSIKVEKIYPCFKSTGQFIIKRNGQEYQCFSTLLDRDTGDFSHILGKDIIIDNIIFTGKRVERFAHCAPWRCGEAIAIMVENI